MNRWKIATHLWQDKQSLLKRAEALIKEKPEQTMVTLAEFTQGLNERPGLMDAMLLLNTSTTGFHVNVNQDASTVQYNTEEVRKISRSFLGFVDSSIELRSHHIGDAGSIFSST